jgi:hypothetical protein
MLEAKIKTMVKNDFDTWALQRAEENRFNNFLRNCLRIVSGICLTYSSYFEQ